jgi:hypothetical protein
MQEVFIRQLSKIAQQLNSQEGITVPWPVQFVVSTHSSHVANAVNFEAIRYFLPTSINEDTCARETKIKDLHEGLRATPAEHKKFLHQYLTLTRCDLFFADKAVLVEGTGERLLLPLIIKKLEAVEPEIPKLSNQYLTIMEVGGAYAHNFFELLDFLELRTLIITDIDPATEPGGNSCPAHQGKTTSNACLKTWFPGDVCSPDSLKSKSKAEMVKGLKRVAFQRSETPGGPCGRTLEDAFMLANPEMFGINGSIPSEQETFASDLVDKTKKSGFALKHSIDQTVWIPPGYILDGLKWLAGDPPSLEVATECTLDINKTLAGEKLVKSHE